jgi:drug/metabolite transporter (DMT)-like permease
MSDTAALKTEIRPVIKAALWMVLALASFVLMAVAARELSFKFNASEIMFFRSAIAVLILLPLVWYFGRQSIATRKPGLQLARNAVHFAGQYCWVLAIALIPLAEVFALEFTTPIFIALLAAPILGEKLTSARWIAVLGGFIGVLVIVRPGLVVFNPASLIALAAALSLGASVIMVKLLTRTDGAFAVVFWMSVMQLPMGAIPAWFVWVTPGWGDAPWLIAMAATGLTAHYAMARALSLADATVTMPIDFCRLPAIALIGYALYAEKLDLFVFLGAALIFAVNYYAVRQETAKHV